MIDRPSRRRRRTSRPPRARRASANGSIRLRRSIATGQVYRSPWRRSQDRRREIPRASRNSSRPRRSTSMAGTATGCALLPASKLAFQLVELVTWACSRSTRSTSRRTGVGSFAHLDDEAQFLCVSTTAPYPSGCGSTRTANLHGVPSVDEFVKRVLDKKDKTPFEVFAKTSTSQQADRQGRVRDALAWSSRRCRR